MQLITVVKKILRPTKFYDQSVSGHFDMPVDLPFKAVPAQILDDKMLVDITRVIKSLQKVS